MDIMDKIGQFGQNWTLWIRLDVMDRIYRNGQKWTFWTKLDMDRI